MPYDYPGNIPRVAKHWTDSQKRRCASAANAVLNEGGTEKEAIFACIHASGVGKKQGPNDDEYDKACEDAGLYFQYLLELYYADEITIDEFDEKFKDGLEEHYARLMLLAIGETREVTQDDLTTVQRRLEKEYGYLDGFVEDIRTGRMTQPRAMWRAGLYGWNRGVYINFTIPSNISDLMEVLPGDDCEGKSLCGCFLDVEIDEAGTIYVYWQMDITKEHCAICASHALESPYIFTLADQGLE